MSFVAIVEGRSWGFTTFVNCNEQLVVVRTAPDLVGNVDFIRLVAASSFRSSSFSLLEVLVTNVGSLAGRWQLIVASFELGMNVIRHIELWLFELSQQRMSDHLQVLLLFVNLSNLLLTYLIFLLYKRFIATIFLVTFFLLFWY